MRIHHFFAAAIVAVILLGLLAVLLTSCGKKKKRPIIGIDSFPPPPAAGEYWPGPHISNVSFSPSGLSYRPGQQVHIHVTAHPSRGGTLTYFWDVYSIGHDTLGLNSSQAAVTVSNFGGSKSGSVTVTETLHSGESRSATRNFSLYVNDNLPPRVFFSTQTSVDLTPYGTRALLFMARATDPDGDHLKLDWKAEGGQVQRSEFYGGDAKAWVVPDDAFGTVRVTLVADDGFGGVSKDSKEIVYSPVDGAAPDSVWIVAPAEVRIGGEFEFGVYAWFGRDKPAAQIDALRILAPQSYLTVTDVVLGEFWEDYGVPKGEEISIPFAQYSRFFEFSWRSMGGYRQTGNAFGRIAVVKCQAVSTGARPLSIQLEDEEDRTVSFYSAGALGAFTFSHSGRANLVGEWVTGAIVRVR